MGEGLHAAHQAILQQGGPVGFQPYRRPLKFPLRVGISNALREKGKAKIWPTCYQKSSGGSCWFVSCTICIFLLFRK